MHRERLSGVITRRYHGYLVAALPAPFGRVMMLNELTERLELPGGHFVQISGEERAGDPVKLDAMNYISEFRLEGGTPVWRYEIGRYRDREKTGAAARPEHRPSSTIRCFQATRMCDLVLRPSIHFRPHETAVSAELESSYTLTVGAGSLRSLRREPIFRRCGCCWMDRTLR